MNWELKVSERKRVLPGADRDYFVFKLVEYQKSPVFPRVLKAKNEGQGKSSDSWPSRGASPDIASLIRTEDYASFTKTSREKIRIDWEKI